MAKERSGDETAAMWFIIAMVGAALYIATVIVFVLS